MAISCDVTQGVEEVKKAIAEARRKHLGLPPTVLINCAGSGPGAAFEDTAIDDFDRLMRLNYLGAVNATRAVVGTMKGLNGGRIVFTSSQAGQLGLYGYTAYSAAKFALRGMDESSLGYLSLWV